MVTVEELEQIRQLSPEAADSLQRLADSAQNSSQRMDSSFQTIRSSARRVSEAIQEGTKNISDFLGAATDTNKISAALESIQNNFSGVIDQISVMDGATREKATRSAIALSSILLPAINENTKAFGILGASSGLASDQITSNFSKLSGLFGKTGADVNEQVRKLLIPAESARNTELALIRLAAASGQLNQSYGEGAITQARLEQVSAGLTARMLSIGDVTKQSSDQILAYINGIGKIPGALDMWMKSAEGVNTGLDVVSGAMKVGSAFGLENQSVIDYLSSSYSKFGTSTDKAVEQLAFFAQTSQDMQLPLDIMQSFLQKTSDGMNTMGDSTVSAVSLLDSFGTRLRDVGTSALGTTDIISGMVNSARDMDLGTAAFVNQAAGGRGGLAGSFEIESLKQEGNFGEIVKRTMEALQKTGLGAPVTLNDVRDNPALAGQLMQQTELLKQFGLAQNNSQAYQVLAAMQKGDFQMGGAAVEQATRTPQEALQIALERGNSIAKTGFAKLVDLGNRAEALQQMQSQQLLKFGREEMGLTGGLTEGGTRGAVDSMSIFRTDIDAKQVGNLSQLTADRYEDTKSLLGRGFDEMRDAATGLLQRSIEVASVHSQSAPSPTLESVFRPADMTEAETKAATAARGTPAGAPNGAPVQVAGDINVNVNIKDGIRTIANETFTARIEELSSRSAVQSFNGNGNN